MKSKNLFNEELLGYIKDGELQRKRLSLLGNEVCNLTPDDQFPHLYLFGNAGIGKTHVIKDGMKLNKIDHNMVTGNLSMFKFGVRLAVINYQTPKNQIRYVVIDDCNEILKNEENLNIVKNMLSDEKSYSYQKSLQNLINSLDTLEQKALSHHSKPGGGFVVPLNKFVFIFTSNSKLPGDDEIRTQKDRHLNAIRSRVIYKDLTMKPTTLWGYITDVILNSTAIPKEVPTEVKEELCLFMFERWSDLTERSVRGAQKMGQVYLKNKQDYKMIWLSDYTK